ncbi:MAG TPA: DUF4157 domain-containing protein, partial [Longimicrobiales bacterium]|nr:DUF4157 domain-containing protein [Longimicrobiales bacterium]
MRWVLRASSRALPDIEEVIPEGVAVRAARWLPMIAGKLSGMRAPAAAVTLGRTIIVHPNVQLTGRLLRHELAHVRQWQQHPVTFPARYVINHLRSGYDANPY